MKPLALALLLTLGCPPMAPRTPVRPPLGVLVKVVRTDVGALTIYRDGAGCTLVLKGVIVDRVSLAVCSA